MNNKKTTSLKEKALCTMKEYSMEADKYIVGFSGGSDSMTLLHFLANTYSKENVIAIHVNHMIRGIEADADELFCKNYCKDNGIAFESVHVDIPKISGGSALEETARNLRYEVLTNKAKEHGATAIALAHNSNDNAETLVFNISRGCGLSGMGIPPVRMTGNIKIIRPLIACTKVDIMNYICDNNLKFVTDSTNDDVNYSRNNIRKNVIPVLSEIKDGAIDNIYEFSKRARSDEDFIDSYAKDFISKNETLIVEDLQQLHFSVLSRVIMKEFEKCSSETITSTNIDDIINLINTGSSGKSIALAGDVSAIIIDKTLKFVKNDYLKFIIDKTEYFFEFDGNDIKFDDKGFIITTKELDKKDNQRVYYSYLPKNFIVRNKMIGDSIDYGSLTKTIKKMTTEVPFDARQRRPVFVLNNNVIWYPGFKTSDYIKNMDDKIKVYYIEKL